MSNHPNRNPRRVFSKTISGDILWFCRTLAGIEHGAWATKELAKIGLKVAQEREDRRAARGYKAPPAPIVART